MVMAGVKAAGPGSKMFSRPFLVRLQELHERLKASDRNGTCIFVSVILKAGYHSNRTLLTFMLLQPIRVLRRGYGAKSWVGLSLH